MHTMRKEAFPNICAENIPGIFLGAAFLIHVCQIVFCQWLQLQGLLTLNLISACIALGLLPLIRRKPALAVLSEELWLCVFSIVATVLTGWETGFYLLPLGMLGASYFLSDSVKSGSGTPMQAVNLLSLAVLLLLRAYAPASPADIFSSDLHSVLFFLWNLTVCVVIALLSTHLSRSTLRSYSCKLEERNQNLEYMAVHDPLTGLHNRWTVSEALSRCKEKSDQTGVPFSVALADVDDFKEFNDQFGHNFGDQVLSKLAESVRHSIGREDFAFRWGGEELLFLFPSTYKSDAKNALLRIQQEIRNIPDLNPPGYQVTLTFGLCEYCPDQGVDQILALADRKMYQGKAQGKNCIVD